MMSLNRRDAIAGSGARQPIEMVETVRHCLSALDTSAPVA